MQPADLLTLVHVTPPSLERNTPILLSPRPLPKLPKQIIL